MCTINKLGLNSPTVKRVYSTTPDYLFRPQALHNGVTFGKRKSADALRHLNGQAHARRSMLRCPRPPAISRSSARYGRALCKPWQARAIDSGCDSHSGTHGDTRTIRAFAWLTCTISSHPPISVACRETRLVAPYRCSPPTASTAAASQDARAHAIALQCSRRAESASRWADQPTGEPSLTFIVSHSHHQAGASSTVCTALPVTDASP